MKIETFELERIQSLWENRVKFNLTESGFHPYTLQELLTADEIEKMTGIRIGYGQTNGSIELRRAISGLYPGTDGDNVLVTNGSAEANFVGICSHLEPGDELIVMLPNYMQIWGIARSLGVTVKPFHLREALNWGPDLEELERMITPRTKMIAVCNPNNPTGAILNPDEMQAIIRLAERAGAWVYADEIYIGGELDGRETPTFVGQYDRVIVASGLAKSYALSGLRIGWLVGPRDFIDNAWAYHDYTSITTGIFGDYIGSLVLQPERRRQVLARSRGLLNDNLAALSGWVQKHGDLFHFIPPRAGGMAFMRYNLDMNSTELATRLREDKSVLIIAGDCFGMDRYIRIGIGGEGNHLLAGLDLIDESLRELRP